MHHEHTGHEPTTAAGVGGGGEILISGGTLIDATGAPARPNPGVLLRGDNIEVVGPGAAEAASAGAERVDADGRTVMPGLIDAPLATPPSTTSSPTTNSSSTATRPPPRWLRARTSPRCCGRVSPLLLRPRHPVLDGAVAARRGRGRCRGGPGASAPECRRWSPRSAARPGGSSPTRGWWATPRSSTPSTRPSCGPAATSSTAPTGSRSTPPGCLPGTGPARCWAGAATSCGRVCDTAHELDTSVMAHCRSPESVTACAEAGRGHTAARLVHGRRGTRGGDPLRQRPLPHLHVPGEPGGLRLNAVGAGAGMEEIFRGEIAATAKMMRAAYDAGVPVLCGSEAGFALTPYGHWARPGGGDPRERVGPQPHGGHRLRHRQRCHRHAPRRSQSAPSPKAAWPTCWCSTVIRWPTSGC